MSTPNTGFLSPASSDLWVGSPPPRPEVDDYIASKTRHEHRKKYTSNHGRRTFNSRKATTVETSAQSPVPLSPRAKCGSNEVESTSKKSETESQPIVGKAVSSIATAGRATDTDDQVSASRLERLSQSASSDTAVAPDSPAVSALRRHSQPVLDPTRPPNFVRRISAALSTSLIFGNPVKPSSFDSRSLGNGAMGSSIPNPLPSPENRSVDQDVRLLGPTYGQQPRTPESITVRKASNAYPDQPKDLTSQGGKPHMNPPSVELVAFFSENRRGVSPQKSHDTFGENTESTAQPRERHNSMAQFSEMTNGRRQSATAEVALTFTDVYVAPGTFSVQHMPKQALPGSADVAQRVSTVQFRTRNSVHEVIWREDETASGSSPSWSSPGSSSPDRSTQFQTIGGLSPEGNVSPSQDSQAIQEQSLQIPFLDPDSGPNPSQPQAELLQFAWNRSIVGPLPGVEKHTAEIVDPEVAIETPNQDPVRSNLADALIGVNRKGGGSETVSHIASFSPLAGRQSASEWYREPLVDLNESLAWKKIDPAFAGRRAKSMMIMRSPSDGEDEDQSAQRRLSEYQYYPAGVGSSLGISSHRAKPQRRACQGQIDVEAK